MAQTPFQIDISTDVLNAYHKFNKLSSRELAAAAKTSINRALVSMRKESVIEIKKHLRVKSSVLKNQYIILRKAKGSKLSNLGGSIEFQSRGLNLIDFVSGTPKVTDQKGIPVKRRPKVRVQIQPGKRFVVKGGFIRNTQSKGLQIMKADSKVRGHLLMQTGPSLQSVIMSEKSRLSETFQSRAHELFSTNYARELNFRMQRLLSGVSPK